MGTEDQLIATLVFPNEYMRNLNSVAGLSTGHISFLKRKFVSKQGWELVKFPTGNCREILYKANVPFQRILGGVFLTAIVAAITAGLVEYWDSLEPGQRVPVGAIALAGIYGIKLVLGARRHKLTFRMQDGLTLTWKSKSGEFKVMAPIVDGVVAFAKSKSLLTSE